MQNSLTLVVFGATGDLYQNKLALALFNLFSKGLLPAEWRVVGFARKPFSDLEFQEFTQNAILKKNTGAGGKKLSDFLLHFKYMQGDLENLESFRNLSKLLAVNDEKQDVCSNKLFHLAVPPALYEKIFKNISEAGLAAPCTPGIEDKEKTWTRILVEKPFGNDMEEAKKLDELLGGLFDESQIFRIDHYLAYLAKGVVDKILNLRFGFGGQEETESRWNNENVQEVRIIWNEKDLVGRRATFFDSLGMLRDICQNHILQMLALVAMENPFGKDGSGVHKARQKVLEKVRIDEKYPIVQGQYEGYAGEPEVRAGSTTETFLRCTLLVENQNWRGVPFRLELGKALDKSEVTIEVCFKASMSCIDFPVSNEETLRDAYDKVFYDCLLGDQTIFPSTGEVMAQWRVTEDIAEKLQKVPLVIYKKGIKGEEIK